MLAMHCGTGQTYFDLHQNPIVPRDPVCNERYFLYINIKNKIIKNKYLCESCINTNNIAPTILCLSKLLSSVQKYQALQVHPLDSPSHEIKEI